MLIPVGIGVDIIVFWIELRVPCAVRLLPIIFSQHNGEIILLIDSGNDLHLVLIRVPRSNGEIGSTHALVVFIPFFNFGENILPVLLKQRLYINGRAITIHRIIHDRRTGKVSRNGMHNGIHIRT